MATDTRDIVRRTLSPKEIQQLIELRRAGKFGFEGLSDAALNAVYLVCRALDLRPGDEVIGYQGQPYINARGTMTLVRRNKEYRGFSQRPLDDEEKQLWGYLPTDLVIATTIRTLTWGEIEQHGKVSRDEIQRGAKLPVGTSPVEMAMKRSLMRAAQVAFGWDAVPTEETVLEGKYEIKRMEQSARAEQYAKLDRQFAGEPEVEAEHESQEVAEE